MKRQSGYILVFVLITILALASMIGYLRVLGYQEIKLVKTIKNDHEAYLNLSALALYSFKKALERQEEGEDFSKFTLKTDYGILRVEFSSENELLDLNQANGEAMQNLFLSMGIEEERAQIMADSLIDWRDSDSDHHLNGAEKEYYQDLGYTPRNGPLKTLEEVVLVRGFDSYLFWVKPGLYQKVTIFGGKKDLFNTPEKEFRLTTGGTYRLSLRYQYKGKSYHYLEIFRLEGASPVVLYQRVLPE